MNVFTVQHVTAAYPHTVAPAVREISFTVTRGSFTAIIGPNGSGKSTLLRVVLGALPPSSGSVRFEDKPLNEYSRSELAKRIGAVTQIEEMPFPITVRELVSTGRYVHLGAWRAEREEDRVAVQQALERCDITALADRAINRVSGGERQRARIARALAQEAKTLVLDEPTAALDIAHEMAVFELLHSLAQQGRTILVATHNINLAARYADSLLLLSGGALVAQGTPAHVMQKDVLEQVYHWPLEIFQLGGVTQVAPRSPGVM